MGGASNLGLLGSATEAPANPPKATPKAPKNLRRDNIKILVYVFYSLSGLSSLRRGRTVSLLRSTALFVVRF
jgi:hypothetical protein